mmetsp:Transcript_12401/g.29180  ORF Transcript_12401/g.29180 Transcript_12401/m.29180 type:complete len:230 (-) Transcript_12401:838-1527(-)
MRKHLPTSVINIARGEVSEANVRANDRCPLLVRTEAAPCCVSWVQARREVTTPCCFNEKLLQALHCSLLPHFPEGPHLEGPIILCWIGNATFECHLPLWVELTEAARNRAAPSPAISQRIQLQRGWPSWRSLQLPADRRHRPLQAAPLPLAATWCSFPRLKYHHACLEAVYSKLQILSHNFLHVEISVMMPGFQLSVEEQSFRATFQENIYHLLNVVATPINESRAKST